MSANDKQVGGTHYQTGGVQHWDLMAKLYGDAHFKCAATKYVARWRKKNGVQDLEKALHYLIKLEELAKLGKVSLSERVRLDGLVWLEMCDGDVTNAKLCKSIAEMCSVASMKDAMVALRALIATLQPPP